MFCISVSCITYGCSHMHMSMMLKWSYLFIFYTQKDIKIDIKYKLNPKLPLTYLVASSF